MSNQNQKIQFVCKYNGHKIANTTQPEVWTWFGLDAAFEDHQDLIQNSCLFITTTWVVFFPCCDDFCFASLDETFFSNFWHKQETSSCLEPVNMFSSGTPEGSLWSAGLLITSLQIVHTKHNTTQHCKSNTHALAWRKPVVAADHQWPATTTATVKVPLAAWPLTSKEKRQSSFLQSSKEEGG